MKTSPLLDRYRGLVDESQIAAIYEVASSLHGLRVLHMNTTDRGGGVAEILHELLPVMEELGIRHDWKVIPLDEASGYFSARVVDMLQGYDMGEFPETEKNVFLEKLRSAVQRDQADMYFIHDFQLAPLAQLYPWMRPALWYCHVDTAQPNPSAQEYIRQFLDPYEIVCFNSEDSIFKGLAPEKTRVVTLGIDTFRVKNRFLPKARGLEILSRCGIDTERTLITQVSRFGSWKNPRQVIDIYRLIKQHMPSVQLALVGAMEAKDDFKAQEILLDLQLHYVDGDPDIHLLSESGTDWP